MDVYAPIDCRLKSHLSDMAQGNGPAYSNVGGSQHKSVLMAAKL